MTILLVPYDLSTTWYRTGVRPGAVCVSGRTAANRDDEDDITSNTNVEGRTGKGTACNDNNDNDYNDDDSTYAD